jgi:hypothetical protein
MGKILFVSASALLGFAALHPTYGGLLPSAFCLSLRGLTIFLQKRGKIRQGCSGLFIGGELMSYLENNPSILDSSSASRSFSFLSSSLYCRCSIILCLCLCSCSTACLSISTVPLNAKINQRHHEGGHCKSVTPDSGLTDEFEDAEVSFVIKSQKRNSNG